MENQITVLDQELQNQIAAGEVIERPASIIKELIENSLDAGATQLDIHVDGGGVERISVRDNGVGMSRDNLAKAALPHATSKIHTFNDLMRIQTFGFRGEALASIAGVARVRIRSRHAGDEIGWVWEKRSSEEATLTPCSHAVGTTVEVEDLFYSIPARRRFLKAPGTEWGHCAAWVERLALAHPEVGFKVERDGKIIWDLKANQSLQDRMHALNITDQLPAYSFSYEHPEHSITGYFLAPTRSQPRSSNLLMYVNGRFVQDKTMRAALHEGLRGVLEVGRSPVGVLRLTVPEHLVDVNVHPSKTEVRFLHGSRVFSWISQSLAHWASEQPWVGSESTLEFSKATASTHATEKAKVEMRDNATWKGYTLQPLSSRLDTVVQPTFDEQAQSFRIQRSEVQQDQSPELFSEAFQVIGQWNAKYILVADGMNLWILDQHAVHERIRYESLVEAQNSKKAISSQMLMLPEKLSCTPAQVESLRSSSEILELWGWNLEFHDNAVELRGQPEDLSSDAALDVLREIIHSLATPEGTEWRGRQHLILATQACKGAIKAGDHLTLEEQRGLCTRALAVRKSAHCPHGRPAWARLPLSQVDALFHRRS